MTTPLRTARDRARSEIRTTILEAARRHLAVDGPTGLSLRAVARELGLVPSAVYRYFENRDALLTAMIVEAYDSLGDAAEAAATAPAGATPRARWVATAVAVRAWAIAHPQEYTLLYGSPVPGYAAPEDTVVPGTRVSLALVGIVRDAATTGLLAESRAPAPAAGAVADELGRLSDLIDLGAVPPAAVFATLLAWTQLFGLLTFELFGQTRGVVDDHAAFFRAAADAMAAYIGL